MFWTTTRLLDLLIILIGSLIFLVLIRLLGSDGNTYRESRPAISARHTTVAEADGYDRAFDPDSGRFNPIGKARYEDLDLRWDDGRR